MHAVLEEEDFNGLNYSMAQLLAGELLPRGTTTPATVSDNVIPTVVGVLVSFFVIILVFAVGLVSFILYRKIR